MNLHYAAAGIPYCPETPSALGKYILEMQKVRRDQEQVAKVAEVKPEPADPINPSHYKNHPSGVECIEIAEHWPFNLGAALRYMWRVDDKDTPVENLKKALWHLEREIKLRERTVR